MEAPTARPSRLALVSIGGSLLLATALAAAYLRFGSQLALAQAADSLSDCLAGAVLFWAMRQSALPADDDHPHGHDRAEPIGALVVAVLVGTLAVEVLRNAVGALWTGAAPELDPFVAAAFAAKVVFKGTLAGLASVALRARANPALEALRLDARNDVLVGALALVGFALARAGWPVVDAVLAAAVAVYVGNTAIRLAVDNVALLMGAAAPPERARDLGQVAAGVPGVQRVDQVLATWHGATLHVYVEVAVDAALTVLDAHEIGHAVEAALLSEPDVGRAVAHIGPV